MWGSIIAGGDPSVELNKRRRKPTEFVYNPQHIVIDCGFDTLMTDKERRKLRNQLQQLYGANMKRERPLTIDITSFGGHFGTLMNQLSGFQSWKARYFLSFLRAPY